ncbi:MAG: 2-hydroxyglutaryl-CoA dehydratase [Deltaproteobacteria bacterium]|nr:2-hydroxyglutaryl-CoA dehydratase [Deltaproteobacteria bacterium]
MYFAGLDIGSTMTKAAIIDGDGRIIGKLVVQTGPEHRRLANKVMLDLLGQTGLALSDVSYLVATGYGRVNVPFADAQTTELTCHAKGVLSFFPSAVTVIDVGGQDAKGLRIKGGRLVNFVMNDKCAAGTGRFLEVLAEVMNLSLDELGPTSLRATRSMPVSNTCTIFAQQEIVLQLSAGIPVEEIIAGVHDAIATRIVRMTRSIGIEPDVVLTGGVAKNTGFVKAVEKYVGRPVLIPEDSFITGALGAALVAQEKFAKESKAGTYERKERVLREATFFT